LTPFLVSRGPAAQESIKPFLSARQFRFPAGVRIDRA
jgi:hypothetical protein